MKVGRLQVINCHRDSEVRWMGTRVQWVISPVQVALWTHMHAPLSTRRGWEPYRSRFTFAPMRRV